MPELLTSTQADLVQDERVSLEALVALLEQADTPAERLRRLRDALDGLRELFLLVVAGEFNAGKSAFINAMLGGPYLDEGVTPTTSQVQLLTHGPAGPAVHEGGYWRHTLPASVLADMHVVDTPGTNAILREHEALTRDFVPRADLVLFVTSADRPFTESERQFVELIRAWGKKIVFVLNKVDLLASAAEREQVVEFVRAGTRLVLGEAAAVFPLSAREALRSTVAGDEAALAASGWPAFAHWLKSTLTAGERLRLKLESPLGIARRVAAEASAEASARVAVLATDRAVLDEVDRSLALYADDMHEQFERRLDGIDKRVLELRSRGEAFLDERFRLSRLRGLLDGERLRSDFEREVIGDTPDAIARDVNALVDWTVDREFAQWQGLRERLSARASEGLRDAARHGGTEFGARRQALLGSVGREADNVVDRFDPAAASARLVDEVHGAITSTALVEVGALGLGLALKALLVSTLEPTGILAAGVVAALGLTIIPYRRRKAAEALRTRAEALRAELRAHLREAFERETGQAVDRMSGAVAPYGRFVRAESAQLEAQLAALAALHERFETLRGRIQSVVA